MKLLVAILQVLTAAGILFAVLLQSINFSLNWRTAKVNKQSAVLNTQTAELNKYMTETLIEMVTAAAENENERRALVSALLEEKAE